MLNLYQTFLIKRTSLQKEVHALRNSLKPRGLLWVSYPKGNQLKADINRDTIAAYAKTVRIEKKKKRKGAKVHVVGKFNGKN